MMRVTDVDIAAVWRFPWLLDMTKGTGQGGGSRRCVGKEEGADRVGSSSSSWPLDTLGCLEQLGVAFLPAAARVSLVVMVPVVAVSSGRQDAGVLSCSEEACADLEAAFRDPGRALHEVPAAPLTPDLIGEVRAPRD